jgi:hypothetical protein
MCSILYEQHTWSFAKPNNFDTNQEKYAYKNFKLKLKVSVMLVAKNVNWRITEKKF